MPTSVTLDWFTLCKTIPKDETREDFPVVVRVTASPGKDAPPAAVDVIAVVEDGRDEALEEAMRAIIAGLRLSDRLAVVAPDVDAQVRVVMELTEMAKYGGTDGQTKVTAPSPSGKEVPGATADVAAVGRDKALQVIIAGLRSSDRHAIVASDVALDLAKMSTDESKESASSETTTPHHDVGAALQEGVQVLRRRGEEEGRKRAGCIVFLSAGGGGDERLLTEEISPDYPVYCFGSGADPLPPPCTHHIAGDFSGDTSGVAGTVVKQGSSTAALPRFTSDLTSAVARLATAVRIDLTAHEDVTISCVHHDGGDGTVMIRSGKNSGRIEIGSLQAGEQKSFVVFLTVTPGRRRLMAVAGRYRSHDGGGLMGETRVSVLRPAAEAPACGEGEGHRPHGGVGARAHSSAGEGRRRRGHGQAGAAPHRRQAVTAAVAVGHRRSRV